MLQANNVEAPTNSADDCDYLLAAVQSWLQAAGVSHIGYDGSADQNSFILWAELLPVRCEWQGDGVISSCSVASMFVPKSTCEFWDDHAPESSEQATVGHFADSVGRRKSEITEIVFRDDTGSVVLGNGTQSDFYVRVFYDESNATSMA